MVSDETYEICLPVLQDSSIEEEDKTDRLEELLRKETSLTGQALENAVPNLNAYEFASDNTPSQEIFGDLQSDNVDWLVSDDAISISSSVGTPSGLNAAAPEFSSSQQTDMTPYDMLRSILGQSRTDEEIDAALAMHGYDLGATISSIMESQMPDPAAIALQLEEQNILIGKSMTPELRPSTPADQKSGVISPAKSGKKHHGKRGGHGHGPKETFTPSSLADIVKMSPSPGPGSSRQETRKLGRNGSSTSVRNGENSAAAQAIPNPKHIPWLETGDKANKAYLKSRQEAIKHGGLRNKFLQSAAQAWNRNDARAAKALSLRGQSENDLMRKAHREAAKELYEERNKNSLSSPEIYIDLHGLHPEEAVEYLERVLLENSKENRPIYAITGTGHHSKNGKDKVGKALRNFLNEWRYAYREFSVPGDRNNMGGILGIDARSWDKSLTRDGAKKLEEPKEEVDILDQGVEIGEGKVRLLVRDTTAGKEPPKGPSGNRGR
ncbi:putative ccch zinc finger and smr domain containing protein [Phaeoacremonium minimum UCRPA7]|uniref:Putative ccch zinc finger and smr domain containing protein n=1 Tax=Phaeoacremonium minimum (strain UCR-PA7) TaxID=1286976 RepID=R8BF54_PHAM7|nr:putative ccch zinc finger and smr domain containing protein [Phaeoacremonium minimum UCRPA7]EON97924.1 putative ccch zinc finger and smr domain containing protein [Phaeoacremonium minimum UCRPA7]